MTEVDDELWNEFHSVANMTSRELGDWLREQSAGEDAEEVPDQAGTQTGRHVLHILAKRRTDLTADDVRVMQNVVDRVHEQRRDDLEPTAGQPNRRHRLMNVGHDPLTPVDGGSGGTRA